MDCKSTCVQRIVACGLTPENRTCGLMTHSGEWSHRLRVSHRSRTRRRSKIKEPLPRTKVSDSCLRIGSVAVSPFRSVVSSPGGASRSNSPLQLVHDHHANEKRAV